MKAEWVTPFLSCTNANTVSQYTIGADGALIPMITSMVACGSSPSSITTVGSYQ